MEEFGADYVTITDEDGTSYEMEILSRFEHEGCEYMALIPADTQDDEPNLEVNILRVVEDGGEEILEAIQDRKRASNCLRRPDGDGLRRRRRPL